MFNVLFIFESAEAYGEYKDRIYSVRKHFHLGGITIVSIIVSSDSGVNEILPALNKIYEKCGIVITSSTLIASHVPPTPYYLLNRTSSLAIIIDTIKAIRDTVSNYPNLNNPKTVT